MTEQYLLGIRWTENTHRHAIDSETAMQAWIDVSLDTQGTEYRSFAADHIAEVERDREWADDVFVQVKLLQLSENRKFGAVIDTWEFLLVPEFRYYNHIPTKRDRSAS